MRTFLTLCLGIVGLAVCGCSSGGGGGTQASESTASGSGAAGAQRLTIAVIPKGSTHEYWKSVHEGADKAAAELGNVDIKWKGPVLESDKDSQIKVVDDFTSAQVNGMVLAPLDDHALAGPVADAAKAGIPVAIIDSGLQGTGYVSFIATDNFKGGQMAGAELAKELNGKGKVIMLRYEVGSASTDAREKGFMDVMSKNPGIQVVSQDQYGGATSESAESKSENLLATHKKGDGLDIDGIYTPNESTTYGMLLTLQGAGVAGKVHFVGFDASPVIIDAVGKGLINAVVVQNPRKMGYLGVKAVVDAINKKPVEKQVDTGATLVTKDNLTKPDIQELIAPPKE
jgi:ribose transport system substrate-binding protein